MHCRFFWAVWQMLGMYTTGTPVPRALPLLLCPVVILRSQHWFAMMEINLDLVISGTWFHTLSDNLQQIAISIQANYSASKQLG